MLTQETINKIKETAREFFEKLTLAVEIDFQPEREGVLSIDVKSDEPQILIGEGGQTLIETQHLLRLMLKKKIKEEFYIDLDVNNYKKKKIEYLKDIAVSAANDVAISKKEKELAPMPAYERRIIHLELQNRSDVLGESVGEGPERRIIIKPRL